MINRFRSSHLYYPITTTVIACVAYLAVKLTTIFLSITITVPTSFADILAWSAIFVAIIPLAFNVVAKYTPPSKKRGLIWALQQPFMGQLLWYTLFMFASSLALFIIRKLIFIDLLVACIYMVQICFVLYVAARFAALLTRKK